MIISKCLRLKNITASYLVASFVLLNFYFWTGIAMANQIPTAKNDTAQTTQDQAMTIHVLANDSDADLDALIITSLTQPANGTAVVTSDQRITYTPAVGYYSPTVSSIAVPDTFKYRASDSQAQSDEKTVSVTVLKPLVVPPTYAAQNSLMMSASILTDPDRIKLYWSLPVGTTNITISRKLRDDTSWGAAIVLAGNATSYVDSTAVRGVVYEYYVYCEKYIPGVFQGPTGKGNIAAGIDIPLVESRGKVVLLVDQTQAAPLAMELTRLEQDLTGDGWTVLRHDVSRTDTVPNIKAIIKADYNADPINVKSVFLFGHVPVPYSGDLAYDAHPEHKGAWPADTYYGEMDGVWTDSTVNSTTAQQMRNRNVPGDGKFDQIMVPGPNYKMELQVGRVDLSNLSIFTLSETELLRRYLNKDHNFRHKMINVQERGLIDSNLDTEATTSAKFGWQNFSVFFGAANIVSGDWLTIPADKSYLWGLGDGAGSNQNTILKSKFSEIGVKGDVILSELIRNKVLFDANLTQVMILPNLDENKSKVQTIAGDHFDQVWDIFGKSFYQTCSSVASSATLASSDPKIVFSMMFGSYFGDWDSQNNLLRAQIATPTYSLTSVWGGRPGFQFHHMALGETIGFSVRVSQSNLNSMYALLTYNDRKTHTALMGDPTLRMHVVSPVSNSTGVRNSNDLVISWDKSVDDIVGYHVYRKNASNAYDRLTSKPVSALSFIVKDAPIGAMYMIRAIKLQTSFSGSYYNASQGVFWTDTTSSVPSPALILGDVSDDGRVTMYDAALVLRYTLGAVFTYAQEKAADVNADGKVDGADVVAIAKIALGLN